VRRADNGCLLICSAHTICEFIISEFDICKLDAEPFRGTNLGWARHAIAERIGEASGRPAGDQCLSGRNRPSRRGVRCHCRLPRL
jgi:hypothetical protein